MAERLRAQFAEIRGGKRSSAIHKQLVTSFYNRLFNLRFQESKHYNMVFKSIKFEEMQNLRDFIKKKG